MNSASPHPIAPSTSRNPCFLRFLVPVIMLCSLFVGAWTTARATTFTVINTNDAGAGSLRQAILDANADGSATAGSPHIITITPTGTVTLASALPALNNHITINGPGAALIVSGNNLFPVFFASQTAAFTIQLNNFTIADGRALGTTSAASPGGVKSGTGGGGGGMGGGLFVNQGTVAINGVTFSNNQAIGGNSGNVGGAVGNGNGTAGGNPSNQTLLGTSGGTGGIAGMCSGTVGGFGGGGGGGAIQGGCSSPAGSAGGFGGGGGGSGYLGTGGVGGGGFGGNGGNGTGCSNGGSGGGGAGLGGAVFVRSGSTFSMSGCTFSNNTATGGVAGSIGCGTGVGANGQGKGGAIFIQAGATATELATTYSANTGGTAGATYFNLPQDNPNVWGNLTATYYYQAGDPAVPGNWNSLIGGGGVAALNFTTGGETFVVPSGRTANVTVSGFTVGLGVTFQVASGGLMSVGSGMTIINNGAFIADDVFRLAAGSTFTNTGTFTVNATGTLRLVDNASMTGSVVTYSTATASLEYFGTAAPTISTVTFPNAMSGSVIINNSGSVTLNAAKTIAGTLTLTNGILTTSAANMLTMSNSAASAVAGGSATSFVQGPMRRAIVTSVTTYSYPVGKGGTYLPFGIVNPTVTATPVVEVEAFSVGGGGTADGTTINTLSSTEYWRAAVFSGTFTNALMQIGKTGLTGIELIGVATAAAGAYTSNGAISFAGGTPPSLTQTVVNTLPAARFFAVGTVVPITYYYESGNANLPGSWGTTSGAGLGTPATSFSTISSSFVVEASSPTATAVANFTLGTGIPMTVQSGCTLAISTGFTMTNNGTLNIAGGATLNVQGSGAVVGSAVTYQASNSLLSYTGTVGKTTTAQELPAIMPGSVTVAHTGVFSLGSSPDIQGTFTVNAGVNVRCGTPQTLSLSGPIVFNGAFLSITGLSIVIKGSGSYTGGSFNTGGGLFVDMTMNRAGLALPTTNMYLSGTLTLTAGTIVPTGKIKMYSSAAGAVTSSGGYVDTQGTGGLERELPAGATGVDYIFPVGRGAQYLPFTLKAPFNTTSAVSYSLEVKSFSTAPTGVPDCSSITSVSATEYWTGVFSGSGGTPVLTGGVALTAPSVGAGSVVGIGGAPLYSAMPGGSVVGGSTVTANTTPLNFGTALRNFAVGNTVAPTVYTFVPASGDPTVLANWSPLPPNFTTQCSEFVIPNGKTALMVGNWTLGAGSSGVKLTVQSGGTLNTGTGAANAVQFAGTGSTFNLDNGATFITRNTAGVNGTSDITGAIQVIGGATGFTTNYGTLVNFSFGTVAGAGQCRFGAVGQKTAITQVASLSTNTPTGSLWSLSSALTVQNALTVVAGDFYFTNSLVLNGVAGSSTVQGPDGRMLPQTATSVLTITNPNGLTVQNGGLFDVLDAAPVPCVLSNDITYQAGATLGYFGITTPRTTGRELPSAMDGSIRINGGSAAGIITLGGATAINGTGVLNLSSATSPLATSAANMLTINNPIVGAVNTGTGYVRGPMRRAIPAGANTGTWEFPISKGVTSLPFALVNPNSVGGSVVEVEAFNTNPVGTADGTTIQTGTISTTEYWQASVFSGGAVTARMLLSKTTLAATQTVGSASAVGGPYSAPSTSTYNNLTLDNLTQNTPQTLSSPNFFAVGAIAAPTTYYYFSGNPNTAASWWSNIGGTGTQAANFTTSGWTFIVPNGYTTVAATANIPLSAGVTLQVAGGGTLNMAGFALTGAGNFDLQANGTLQISRTDGVNGNSAATGAIQLTGTVSYAATANYILNVPGIVSNANFAAVGVKPLITNAQNLTITGNQFITLATGLALSGALTVNCASASAGLNLVGVSAQTLALNGPGSVIQSGVLGVGNNFTLANNNAVTPLSLASSGSAILRTMATALPLPIISGNPVNYASSSYLEYLDAVTGTRNTGAELPPIMNGAVMVAAGAGSVFILSAPSTLNATINFGADGRIVSTPTNLLTIGNTSPTSIIGASATRCITGVLARAVTPGANTYSFPLGGGTAATYIPVTFAYTSAPASTVVTIEGFNTAAPGTPGTGITALSATEYWRVNASMPVNAATLTFTRVPATTGFILGSSGTGSGTYNGLATTVPTATTILNTTPFAPLSAGDSFYAIGTATTTYYYVSGNPNVASNWNSTIGGGGLAAANFTTSGWTFIVPNGYTTAAATANIPLSAGVTLQVAAGGTLNVAGFAITGAGNFQLQAGGTLQTSNTGGINGTSAGTGAIQVPGANISYSPTANYIVGTTVLTGALQLNLAAVVGKPAITQAAAFTTRISAAGGNQWDLNSALTLSGAATLESGVLQISSGGALTLGAAGNVVQNTATMTFWVGGSLTNTGGLTIQSGGGVNLGGIAAPTITGMPFNYLAGSNLSYGLSTVHTAGAELPASMDGNVSIGNQSVSTGAITFNGTLNLSGASRFVGGPYTITNTAVGTVSQSGTAHLSGAVRRALPAGAGVGTWIFPVGVGGTSFPFSLVNPTSGVGGSVVEVQAFSGSAGVDDGTTITGLSGTEYWSASVFSGAFTSGFVRVGKTGLTASNLIGSATAGVHSSNGANTFNGVSTPPTLTRTVVDNLAAPTTFAVGSGLTYYYYESGNPNLAGSWGTTSGAGLGTPATDFVTPGTVFVIENGYTATLTANLTFGTLTNGVTLTVQSGGTLNTDNNSVIITGNTSAFNLQNGATFVTRQAQGINGTSLLTGAVRVNNTPTITYGTLVNFVLGGTGVTPQTNFQAFAPKPAITQVASLTVNTTTGNPWILNSPLTVVNTGTLTINTGVLRVDATAPGGVLTLNGAGNTVAAGARLHISTTLNNIGGLNIGNNAELRMEGTGTPVVTGLPVTYATGGILQYLLTSAAGQTAGLEFPSAMTGNVVVNIAGATPTLTLAAPRTMSAASTLTLTNGRIVNTNINLLTTLNGSPGPSITRTNGYIDGFLERTIGTAGASYLFPMGQGVDYLGLTFTDAGGAGTVIANAISGGGGTPGGGIATLNSSGRWQVLTSGGSRMGTVQLTPSSVLPANSLVGLSTTLAGTYSSIGPAAFGGGASITQITAQNYTTTPNFLGTGGNYTTYYYNNANVFAGGANNPANWDATFGAGYGTAAPNFTSVGSIFVVENGATATLTADLAFGTGAIPVTLTVPSGATLNTATFAVQFAGDNSIFNLQNGATLMTQNVNGINGNALNNGTVQIIGGAAGVAINYGSLANYVLGPVTGAVSSRMGASGGKPATWPFGNLTINATGTNSWTTGSNPTLNGTLTVQSGIFQVNAGGSITLNMAGGVVQNGATLSLNGGQLINAVLSALTVQSGGTLEIASGAIASSVTTNPVQYNAGGILDYNGSPNLTTSLELPATMNGNVILNTPNIITLGGAASLNGTLSLQNGTLVTSAVNMLTVINTAAAAVSYTGGVGVQGPMQRALPNAGGAGTWLFPVSKGGTYLPFAVVNPAAGSASAVVEAEAYNTTSGGTPDGTTLIAPFSLTEYWRAQIASGTFAGALMQIGKTGVIATNSIGSSTTVPLGGTYSSNGANNFTAGTPPTLTRTVTDNLAAPTYFAVGANAPIFYYQAGDPNTPANWNTLLGGGGTAAVAGDFTSVGRTFVVPNGRTATLTNNLVFGSGANNVTFTVQSGGTLNTGTFSVQFAGNNSAFNLQNGATLQTSNASGINGIGNNDGAIQINPPLTTGVVISYGASANYILGAIGATTDARFGDISGNKQAITQAASLTVNPGASRTWILSGGPLTLSSGALTVQSGTLSMGSCLLTLSAAGSTVQNMATLMLGSGSQIDNTGGLTIQNGGTFTVTNVTTLPIVATNPISYALGSNLSYFSHPALATGLEFPSPMNGNVSVQSGGPLTLNGAKSLNGTFGITGVLITDNTNMLTIANTAAAAVVHGAGGEVRGPMRRALPVGGPTAGTWLFPVGKGVAYLPFAVNDPTTAGGATIEVEAYNTAPTGGTTDGITMSGALGAEHWQVQVASGSFTSGLMQAGTTGLTAANLLGSSTTAPPTATAYASNGANVLGTLTAVSSLTRSITDNLAAPTYFAVGAVVPIYYYNAGDAATPGNWWTGIGGTGTPATNFTTPGTTFIVEPTHTPATGLTSFTLGANVTMNVQNNATLQIANGITLTNNSALLNVQAGGTLRIMGNGAVSTTPVNYLATTSTLEYAGAGLKTSTTIELPLVMPGSLLINKTAPIPTFALGANTQINGTLTAQAGSFDISGRILQPNGAIVFSGGTINGSATATLDIAGTGSITGSALFTGIMGSLSMNRAAATLSLGTPLDISAAGVLTLNQGFIQTTPTNILRTTNTAPGAIVGTFGANSHIVGPLRRSLAAAGTYSFPVGGGTAATYNPATLTYTAGGGTVEVEPFFTTPPSVLTSGLMGSLGSASEYWRVTPSVALTNADLTFQRVPGMTNGVNLLGVAPTANGTYNGYASTVVGSTIMNTAVFPTLAAGNGFYAVGTGVTTFYYRGGGFDPNIAGNWYTGLGGTGSPAPNFTGAGYTFIVPAPETAVLTGNFNVAATVLLQVAIGGTLDVGGFQVTGAGDFDLQLGGTLRAANATGFNGGAIVNTGARTWSPGANYVFIPTVGPDVNINIATATVNNLTTQGAGATRINANLQVNGVLSGNGRITNCTATLTLGAGTHTLTQEMWFANTSVLTVNGTLNVSTASGAITLIGNGGCGVGSGVVNGSGQINYAVGSSLNAGSNWIGTIAQVALPAIMNGNVSMSNGVQATLGAGVSSQINGTFSLNGSSRLNIGAGNTLTLNDAITLGAGSTFGGTATSNISVTGTGTITGALTFAGGAQTLNNFTLNRAGANPALGSPLTVAGTLALTNGVITNTLANMLTVSNTVPGAVAAGGGYVDGFLERAFGAAGAYTFPVGQGIQPLPMTFADDGTGTGTLIVNAQAGGGGTLGTAITSLYTTGRWELRNSIIGTRTGTVAVTPSAAVPAVSVIGLSTTGIGGTYNSIGPALFLGGASIAQTLPQNFTNTSSFLATGSAIPLSTRYYFISGDASNPASWNSLPNGTGTVAPSFLIPGVTFYVMGNVSGISTTVATVQSNITLGAGAEIVVETPSVLGITDGVTLTNNGTVTVRGTTTTGATLLLDGTGAVTGTVVSYGSALARVQYSGSGTTRPTSPTEFPNVMPATVVVDENVTVVLDDHKTLSSALVLGGLLDIRNRNVILQGRLDLRGAFISDGLSDLEIGTGGGTPAGITGALKIATNVMRNVTLNRPGSSVLLGSPLLIQGGLSLARGILRSDTTNHPILVNTSFNAIVGGNDSSFVEGPIRRYFPTNILTGGAGSWLFPTGRGSRYLPFTLVDPRTGGDAPLLQAEAFTGAPGGTLDGTLSSAGQGEYWNVRLVAGNHTQSRAELGRYGAFAQAIPPGSVVAKSPTQSGVYTNIGGAVAGFAIQSGTFATFSTFTIGSPFSTIPASQQPTLTSFGPAVGTSATRVLVEGTNLGALSSVLVGGVPVSFTVVSPTQITLVLNPGVQSGPITLTTSTSGSATSFQPFTFIGPPTMATVSPQYFGVGQDIIINGNNFYGTPTVGELYLPVVRIGGITASNVEIISPTQLRVRFPVATTGNLTVQSWGGIATTASVVGVLPTPRVVSLSPSTAGAGETVTLTGTDFRLIGSVSIGGIPVTEYVVTSSTGITLRVPPGATTGTIRILGAGGSTTSTQQLTIIPPPVITSFTPGSGSAGQIVTLTGTNFTDATSVRFGNTTATFTVSADGRTIQAIIPAGVVTGATMSVTTRGGTATSGTGFLGTLPPDPTITGFEPVPVVEGGLLTVRGVNFPYNPNNPLANVILGGVAVPGAFYTSSTTLVFRVPQGVVPVTMLSTQAIITLQTPRGATSASLQVPIRAADAPVITGFSPEEGDSVTMITIEGRNFGSSPRTTILDITIGGVPVQSFVVVNSRVIVSVAGAVTSGAIVIRTPSGTVTTTGTFRYTGTPVGGVSPQDSLALLRLYTDLGGPGWTDRTNWGRGFVDSWHGVTVENGRVTELTLGNNNVRGALSTPSVDSALAQLSGLRVLDVSNNGLTGTLPRSIGKLTLLETLNLSKNKLTGGLKDLCGLVRLRDLDVSNNALRDSLSGVLCCLTNLERANVSNNRIYGAVPLCLLELERLSFLDASGNELSDSLPPELVGMRSLTVLNLRRNRLVGTLPAAWGNGQAKTTVSKGAAVTTLAGLQTLDLGANGITGMIPESWSALTGLRVLALDSNRLTGAVPAGFAQLGRLQTLSLGRNSLSDIPDLRGIARLSVVGLADNAFEFGPLEGHRARVGQVGTTFTYIPQAEVGVAREMAVPPDAPWDVTIEVSGTNNRYEWQKRQADGSWKTAFATNTSASVRFATFAVADAGVYRCAITNSYLPGLVLLSRPQTVRPVALTNAPAVPILVEPETNETTALRPVFVWTTSIGAAGYELQVATEASFRVVANVQRVGQTLEAVETGVVEAVSTLKLERSTRYYWRVLSQNSFGSSVWSTAGTFTTAEKDIAFTARIVEFGRVPRLDMGVAVLRVRNVADGAATLVSAVAEQVGASSVFRVDASASVVGGVRFAVGEVREYPVAFVPSAVRRYDAGVAFAYSVNGQRDTWTQAQRLRGVGSALKLLAPSLDTILIGLPRVSAALLINRGDVEMMVTQTRLLANGRGAFALKGATTFSLGAGDTTAVLVRCAASAPGALPRVVVEAAGYGVITTGTTTTGAMTTSTTFVDTARVEIRSFARRRVPTDLVALIGARAKAVTALPPGTTLPIELYLNTEVSTGRDTLQRLASPLVSGSVRYGNQVMTLSAGERSWRRARNTSAGNRLERAVMPETALNRSNSPILTQFQGQIVAGDTDTTTVEIEDVRWSGVYLIEYEASSGTVRARVSEAGGKRLIGSVVAGATPTIVAIAPNPAREEVEVRYTLPTEGVVRLVLMDARGTEVMVLVGGERQQAGEYSVRRAVVGMASGNYTLRLTLGGSTARQNMTIVR